MNTEPKRKVCWGRKHTHRLGPARAANKRRRMALFKQEQGLRRKRAFSKAMTEYFLGLRDNPPRIVNS